MSGDLRFVIISDRTGGARPGVFERGLAVTDLLAPDFAVQLGDVIEGYTDDPVQVDREWDELQQLYACTRTPIIQVPGNHDVTTAVQRTAWRDRFGPSYYHFRTADVLCCVLDSQDSPEPVADQPLVGGRDHLDRAWNGRQPGRLGGEQLSYWENTLVEHADVRWTFVFVHMPLWQGEHPDWQRFRRALGLRQYTAFAGHVHHYQHQVIAGRLHVRLGPTGGTPVFDDPERTADHVTQVTMTERGPVIANVALTGVRGVEGRPAELTRLVPAVAVG